MIEAYRDGLLLRRAIFVAVNLVSGLIVWMLVILPMRNLIVDRDTRIAEQRQTLARLSALAAQAQTVEGLLSQSEAVKDRVEFLRGTNPGVIAADLQTKLTSMVQAAGGRVRSIRTLPAKTDDQIRFIGAQVELSGPIRAITQMVYSVENATPYLFIAGAAVKPSLQQGVQAGLATGTTDPVLDAQLDIVGALQPEGAGK